MGRDNETPEERREKMRQEELKKPSSSMHGNNLSDLVGGLNWKVTGSIILILAIGIVVYAVLFH